MRLARIGRALRRGIALGWPWLVAAQPSGVPEPDLTRLVAHRDSLVAIAAGERVGWMRTSLRRTADGGWRWVETLDVADAVSLTTLVHADPQLAWRQLMQTGEVWERSVAVERHVTGGRMAELNLVPVLVLATPWRDGVSGTWRLAEAATGEAVTLTVRCEGREPASAEGPAAWRVVVARGGTRTRYRVSAEAPWRLVGVATEGLPFRFSLP